jgi:hypothetical protein
MGEPFDGLGQFVSDVRKRTEEYKAVTPNNTNVFTQRRLYARHLPQVPNEGRRNPLLVSSAEK